MKESGAMTLIFNEKSSPCKMPILYVIRTIFFLSILSMDLFVLGF